MDKRSRGLIWSTQEKAAKTALQRTIERIAFNFFGRLRVGKRPLDASAAGVSHAYSTIKTSRPFLLMPTRGPYLHRSVVHRVRSASSKAPLARVSPGHHSAHPRRAAGEHSRKIFAVKFISALGRFRRLLKEKKLASADRRR